MILRIDRIQTELPPPVRSRSRRRGRRAGAAGRQVRRDVDLHELHVPVVQLPHPPGRAAVLRPGRRTSPPRSSATSSSSRPRSTRCSPAPARRARCPSRRDLLNPQHFVAGGAGTLVQDSNGKPWNGDYVTSTGDLVEDLDAQLLPRDRRAQQQAQGLRDGRPPGRPRADRLPAGPRRRPPGRVRPGGREPDRREPDRSCSRRRESPPTRSPSASRTSRTASTSSSTASPRATTSSWPRCSTARTRRPARTSSSSTTRPRASPLRPARAGGRLRARLRAGGDRGDRQEAAQGRRPGR